MSLIFGTSLNKRKFKALKYSPILQIHFDGIGPGQRERGDAEAVLGPRHRPRGGCERQRPPLRDGREGDLVRRERAGRHQGHQVGGDGRH
jgi:hypothetical protein